VPLLPRWLGPERSIRDLHLPLPRLVRAWSASPTVTRAAALHETGDRDGPRCRCGAHRHRADSTCVRPTPSTAPPRARHSASAGRDRSGGTGHSLEAAPCDQPVGGILVKCAGSEYCRKCAGPAAGTLSPDPIATNGASAPRGREVWGTGFDCGAGVVSLPTSSLAGAKAVAPTSNDAQRRAKQAAQRLPATQHRRRADAPLDLPTVGQVVLAY
jgi:hypothetical protein